MTVFHRLNVAAIERETPDAVAITLRVPEELQNQYRYTPGQHLTLQGVGQRRRAAALLLHLQFAAGRPAADRRKGD